METEVDGDIRKGLIEKRARLDQWRGSAPEQEQECCLASEDDARLEDHLQVIDNTLEKIESGDFGKCEICHEAVDSELLQMDYTTTVCLGHYSPAELRELESELELSQVVQRALLPQTVPSLPGVDLAAFNRPAQIVGGDYFDFLQFKDGAAGFVVADVSGHGVSAGMLMTSLQTAFHTLVPNATSPVEVLERINRLYIHNINFTTFVTIFFGRLDLNTQTMTYVNAGHNPGLWFRKESGEIERLEPTNPAVGLVEGFTSKAKKVKLSPGDRLLLYTDGITEAIDPQSEQFGEGRLSEIMRQNPNLASKELLTAVRQSLSEFTRGVSLKDDVTMLACGFL